MARRKMLHRSPCPVTMQALDELEKKRRRKNGTEGRLRGRENEERVISLLKNTLPRGITGVRRASKKEDAKGIDVVLTSAIGDLFLQIKSSNGGKRDFAEKRRAPIIATVVVPRSITDQKLYNILDSKIQGLRRAIHKIRRKQHQKRKAKVALLK